MAAVAAVAAVGIGLATALATVCPGLDAVARVGVPGIGVAVLVQRAAVIDVRRAVVIRHDGVLAEHVGNVAVAVHRAVQDVLEARVCHAMDGGVVDIGEIVIGGLVAAEVEIDAHIDGRLAVDVDMRAVFVEVGIQVGVAIAVEVGIAVAIEVGVAVTVQVAVAVRIGIAVTVQVAIAVQVAVVGFAVLRLSLVLALALILALSLVLALALSLTLKLALQLRLQLSLTLALSLVLVLILRLAVIPWPQDIFVLAHNDHLKLRPRQPSRILLIRGFGPCAGYMLNLMKMVPPGRRSVRMPIFRLLSSGCLSPIGSRGPDQVP
ncbi:hypothetical protein JVX98_04335 (plasmid) [Ensifer sp. PDNC004]|nr:hypothetical protein JVX98_04335 [Ensifer sp. PDNC004]